MSRYRSSRVLIAVAMLVMTACSSEEQAPDVSTASVAGELPTVAVLPGEEVMIPLEVIPPPHGSKTAKVVAVTSPPSPEASLMIVAKGRSQQPPFYEEVPHVVNLAYTVGTPFSGVARFACIEKPDTQPWIKSTRMDGRDDQRLSVDLRPLSGPTPYPGVNGVRRKYKVIITGDPDAGPVPDFDVVLHSNTMATDPHRIRFHVKNTPLVRSIPEIIRWQLPVEDSTRSRSVILVFAETGRWSVIADETSKWLSVRLDPPIEASLSQLRLELQLDEEPAKPLDYDLVLTVSSADRDSLRCRIPIRFGDR